MPYATVVKKSLFDAAHKNPGFGEGHKCARTHGHTFSYEVGVRAKIDPKTGLSIDFGAIKKAMKEAVDDVLDHRFLNEEIPYFKIVHPSAENIAIFILASVDRHLMDYYDDYLEKEVQVSYVKLDETPTSSVIIRKEDL